VDDVLKAVSAEKKATIAHRKNQFGELCIMKSCIEPRDYVYQAALTSKAAAFNNQIFNKESFKHHAIVQPPQSGGLCLLPCCKEIPLRQQSLHQRLSVTPPSTNRNAIQLTNFRKFRDGPSGRRSASQSLHRSISRTRR
jgi:hypothetical protein